MPLTVGQILQSRYRIVSMLGEGGMGTVYRAWHLGLKMPVAIKEMVPQPGLDQAVLGELRKQFEQEATVLARLRHPHLVLVIDHFIENGSTYLVMDFVEGESLADQIRRKGPLPETDVLRIASHLLDALAYCHDQGVIHRDIKPANIILRPTGDAVLVDFGLVKLWDPKDPRTKTVIRGTGTPEYAPLEQYGSDGIHTGPHSDIYSLGATLYHALVGQAPPTVTDRMLDPSSLISPTQIRKDISAQTEEAILKAMAVQPAGRFQTAVAMRGALQPGAVRGRTPTKAIPRTDAHDATPTPRNTRAPLLAGPSPKKASQWIWAVGALAALLVCGLGVASATWLLRTYFGPQAYSEVPPGSATRAPEATARAQLSATEVPNTSLSAQNPDLIIFEKWLKDEDEDPDAESWGDQVELWRVNADGSGLKRLTSGDRSEDPTFSPDRSAIAYSQYSPGGWITVMDLRSGATRPIYNDRGLYPQWLDPTTIIFADTLESGADSGPGWHLIQVSIPADDASISGEAEIIDVGPRQAFTPRVSPDASMLAFSDVTDRDGEPTVCLMAFDTRAVIGLQVAGEPVRGYVMNWHPSAEKLVVYNFPDCLLIDIEEQTAEVLEGIGQCNLSWSLDGTQIVYEYNREIWLMDSDGSNKRPLVILDDDSHLMNPIWSN